MDQEAIKLARWSGSEKIPLVSNTCMMIQGWPTSSGPLDPPSTTLKGSPFLLFFLVAMGPFDHLESQISDSGPCFTVWGPFERLKMKNHMKHPIHRPKMHVLFAACAFEEFASYSGKDVHRKKAPIFATRASSFYVVFSTICGTVGPFSGLGK